MGSRGCTQRTQPLDRSSIVAWFDGIAADRPHAPAQLGHISVWGPRVEGVKGVMAVGARW